MNNIVRAPCQLCGEDRPLKQVTLMQNIGVVALPTNLVNYIGSRSLDSR
jgi:hypothetical protein